MKSLIYILISSALFASIALPQDKIFKEVFSGKFTNERFKKIHNANVDVLQRTNYIESLLLKSQNDTEQTALRNPQREFYEEEGFNAKNTRTNINKTLLGDGFLLIEEYEQYWDSSAWVNNYKDSYTYDVNNNLTEFLGQYWDGSAWVNIFEFSYSYDVNNNQTEWLGQFWVGSAWVNVFKVSYTYDVNNNRIEALWQDWDGSDWVNSTKHSYTYDGNNNLTELLGQTWDGSDWVNVDKSIYSYIPTDVKEITGEFNDYSLSNNYPNPFNPSTTIKYSIPQGINVTLRVYDILGNEIATLIDEYKPAGNFEIEFDASSLSSGIYFYQLRAENYTSTKKMLLIK